MVESMNMYCSSPTRNGGMWSAITDTSSFHSVKYEDVLQAGPPSAPLEFPTPQIRRGKIALVTVKDHVSKQMYYNKEVVMSASDRTQQRCTRAYLLKKRIADCTHGVVRLAIVLERAISGTGGQDEARDCPETEWRSTNKFVAVKVIPSEWKSSSPASRVSSNPMTEISSLQLLGSYHHNVLGCLDVLQSNESLFIITPYQKGKDLHQKLLGANYKPPRHTHHHLPCQQPFRKPREKVAKSWFKDILYGLIHLSRKGICHRNLSLENLLLDAQGKLVIADFGFALRVPHTDRSNFGGIADVSEGSVRRLMTTHGHHGDNLMYLAPELLVPALPFDGFAIDMWAAGVVLFILLVGRAPFRTASHGDKNYVSVAQKGQLRVLLQYLSIEIGDDAMDLLQNLLWEDPRRRLTLQEALAHPWLCEEPNPLSQPSSDDETETSKSTRFTRSPSSECKDVNYRVAKLSEDAICQLSVGRMASF